MEIRIDHGGAEEVLKKLDRDEINRLARKVAEKAGDEAVVHEYTTDRAAASVSVPAELQAKHGVLTRAAAEAGLEIRLRK